MAYCRFSNTETDLIDCYEHIWDNDLSDDEKEARKRLIQICRDIAEEFPEELDEVNGV